jgi:hypothetical protein
MTVDFYALLRKRIPDLEDLSASSRGGLYREVVASTAGMIADAKPPLTPGEAAELRTALDEAIKKIEAEFVKARLEDNQYAPDWALPPTPAAPAASKAPPVAAKGPSSPDRKDPGVSVRGTNKKTRGRVAPRRQRRKRSRK